MKRYEKYKNSGVQWIGQVPTHWILSKLKYGLQGMQDGTHGSYESVISENPLLSAKNVFEDGLHISDAERTISQKDYDSIVANGFPQYNDIVLCCVGTIGRCCIYKMKTPLAFQRSVTFLRVNKSLNPIFLLYSLRSDIFKPQYELYAKTTAQSGIYMGTVANMAIILPPLPEQQAIASFLDAKTKPIDDIIAKREKQIKLLEEMKSTIISRAVTKGLNPDAQMKDSGIEWIGEIPEGWEMRKLKYILKSEKYNIKTGPFGTQLKGNDLREEGDVPVYNQRNVIDNQFHSPSVFVTLDKANELAGFHTKPNDVLITSRGTIGKAAILPNGAKEGILHPCLIALRINQDLVNLKYLLYYINGFEGFAINVFLESNATTIEVIYTDTLKNIFVTLPQLEEQKRIVSYLDSETSKIDIRIAKRRKQIELLQEYKQALITAAVTGKIDVREYNS